MIIIELNEGPETLADIERICRHLSEHKELVDMMTPEQREDIAYVLKPTLAADQDESEKRAHWQKLLTEFVIKDQHGETLSFYRDSESQRLYFGNRQGFETIEGFVEQELHPNLAHRHPSS